MREMACTEVLSCEQRRKEALLVGDTETLSKLLSQNLIYVHSTGVRDSRSTYLAKLQTGSLSYLSLIFEDLQVQAHGDSAIVNGSMKAQIVKEGQIKEVRSLFLTLWWLEKDDQDKPKWQLRAHQGTPLPI
jgi:ketosteroid isomerase-like protein